MQIYSETCRRQAQETTPPSKCRSTTCTLQNAVNCT
jgi:hypothetical protein